MSDQPYWTRKRLEEMTSEEWERLCSRCGRCCLVKLEDEDSGVIDYTVVACQKLDLETCLCTVYDDLDQRAEDCVNLSPAEAKELEWLPSVCAYRLVASGQPLPAWHPLICGDPEAVHEAGQSLQGRAISEEIVDEDDLQAFISDLLR